MLLQCSKHLHLHAEQVMEVLYHSPSKDTIETLLNTTQAEMHEHESVDKNLCTLLPFFDLFLYFFLLAQLRLRQFGSFDLGVIAVVLNLYLWCEDQSIAVHISPANKATQSVAVPAHDI